jgi:hypothetical protein
MQITIEIPDYHLARLRTSEIEDSIEQAADALFRGARLVHLPTKPELKVKPKSKAQDQREVVDYCLSIDLTEDDGGYFWDRMLVNDWKIAKQPVKDWKAAVRTWKRQGYFPSQKYPQAQQHNLFPTG